MWQSVGRVLMSLIVLPKTRTTSTFPFCSQMVSERKRKGGNGKENKLEG